MARILVVAVFVVFSFVALGTGVARHFATPANVTSEVGGNFVPRQSADYHAGAERPIPPVKMPKS